jgi:hypothetical protein
METCPHCKTWTPGDANGDGSVIVCRVCAANGRTVRLNDPECVCGPGGVNLKASLAAFTAGTEPLAHLSGAEYVDTTGWWRNCRACKSTYVLNRKVAAARVRLAVAA